METWSHFVEVQFYAILENSWPNLPAISENVERFCSESATDNFRRCDGQRAKYGPLIGGRLSRGT